MSYKRLASACVLLVACGGRATTIADVARAPTAIVEESASLVTSTGTIAGTLTLPAARLPVPVVLIIAGSGPTDRNGNSKVLPGFNNSLKMLAEGLAARGIASLRYDKRGIAESSSAGRKEEDLRFDHYVSDASDWTRQLRSDKRFSPVVVAGHSEGSLIGMIAAREAGADGYVSIAGIGRKASEVIHEQLSAQVSAQLLAQADSVMSKLERGEKPDNVPPVLNALFRPSVQPYLTSWFRYDPTDEIAKLRVPVVILQGTTDLQVKVDDARKLSSAKPDAKLVLVEGMNHVLKTASGSLAEQLPSYSDPDSPIPAKVLEEIASFVKSISPQPARPRVKDSVAGIDKLKHFLLGGFVESVAFAGMQAVGAERSASLAGAGAATAVVALGREVHGRRVTGLFSFGDLMWDALGAGAAMLILTRINK